MLSRAQVNGSLALDGALVIVVIDHELPVDEQKRAVVGRGIEGVIPRVATLIVDVISAPKLVLKPSGLQDGPKLTSGAKKLPTLVSPEKSIGPLEELPAFVGSPLYTVTTDACAETHKDRISPIRRITPPMGRVYHGVRRPQAAITRSGGMCCTTALLPCFLYLTPPPPPCPALITAIANLYLPSCQMFTENSPRISLTRVVLCVRREPLPAISQRRLRPNWLRSAKSRGAAVVCRKRRLPPVNT